MGFSAFYYLAESNWETDDRGDVVIKTLKNRDGQTLEVVFDVLGFITVKLDKKVINQGKWNGNDSSMNTHLKQALQLGNRKAKSVFA